MRVFLLTKKNSFPFPFSTVQPTKKRVPFRSNGGSRSFFSPPEAKVAIFSAVRRGVEVSPPPLPFLVAKLRLEVPSLFVSSIRQWPPIPFFFPPAQAGVDLVPPYCPRALSPRFRRKERTFFLSFDGDALLVEHLLLSREGVSFFSPSLRV